MNSKTITPVAPPPPPPEYELYLTEKEMLHLAAILFKHEAYEPSNLYGQLPDKVKRRIMEMSTAELDSHYRHGWRDRT